MGIKKILILSFLAYSLHVHARQVAHIEITESGHYDKIGKDNYGYTEMCKLFNPTKEQLITYFSKAEEADSSGEWLHEYYSPCIASGTVTFIDGTYGTWALNTSGLGGITFKDKKNNGKRKAFLHLDNEWENE